MRRWLNEPILVLRGANEVFHVLHVDLGTSIPDVGRVVAAKRCIVQVERRIKLLGTVAARAGTDIMRVEWIHRTRARAEDVVPSRKRGEEHNVQHIEDGVAVDVAPHSFRARVGRPRASSRVRRHGRCDRGQPSRTARHESATVWVTSVHPCRRSDRSRGVRGALVGCVTVGRVRVGDDREIQDTDLSWKKAARRIVHPHAEVAKVGLLRTRHRRGVRRGQPHDLRPFNVEARRCDVPRIGLRIVPRSSVGRHSTRNRHAYLHRTHVVAHERSGPHVDVHPPPAPVVVGSACPVHSRAQIDVLWRRGEVAPHGTGPRVGGAGYARSHVDLLVMVEVLRQRAMCVDRHICRMAAGEHNRFRCVQPRIRTHERCVCERHSTGSVREVE